VLEEIISAVDNNEHVTGLLLDLEKAFDCVDKNALLSKLWNMGIRGKAHDILQSYMTNRKQYVSITSPKGVFNSQLLDIKYGVPQGSILGPFLFILYINDIEHMQSMAKITLYADDTTIICKNPDFQKLEIEANQIVNSVVQYFNENRLKVNTKKSNFLLFNKRKTRPFDLGIQIDDEPLVQLDKTKLLGLVLDDELKWDAHIDELCLKISKGLFVIRRLKELCNINILKQAYYAFIYSHINYGIELWGNSTKQNLNRILKVQKNVIRCITGMGYRESCRSSFTQMNLLTVINLFIFRMFLAAKSKDYGKNLDCHSHDTRNKHKLHITSHRTTLFQKSHIHMAIKFINTLHSNTNINSNKFKTNLFNWLIEHPFYCLEEYFEEVEKYPGGLLL
jgi:hypothetical protein